MSQSEIINLLEKEDKPLSVGEIAILLNDNQKKISRCLASMLKYSEVCFIEIDRIKAMKTYHCKHRMRLWFVNGNC